MHDKSNKRAAIVGLFVGVGVLFFIGGILMVGNLHETFKKRFEIAAVFDDVSGLQKGNNVWFSGVKIGTVSNIHFFGKSQVQVVIKIENMAQQYIHKDAMVKISSDGIIGNKILIIYGGTLNTTQVQEGDILKVEKTFSTEDMINTLQDNNKNFLVITNNFKTISDNMASGKGTIGRLINDDEIYTNINAATASLRDASVKAQQLITSLASFSSGLNKKGTLGNELITDTVIFNSVKLSVINLQHMSDSANAFIVNLKKAGSNPNTTIGVLLHDEVSGARIRETIVNLESSSKRLNADLEAAQHNILLRGFFRNKSKQADNLVPQK